MSKNQIYRNLILIKVVVDKLMRLSIIYASIIFVMFIWGFNVVAVKIVVEQFLTVTITSLRIFYSCHCHCCMVNFIGKKRNSLTK